VELLLAIEENMLLSIGEDVASVVVEDVVLRTHRLVATGESMLLLLREDVPSRLDMLPRTLEGTTLSTDNNMLLISGKEVVIGTEE